MARVTAQIPLRIEMKAAILPYVIFMIVINS
jgi:hypothetical protein